MAVTINGSTGFAGVTGNASAPAVQGTSANSGIYFGGNTINMATSGSQVLTINSSGNIGIGTTTVNNKLEVGGVLAIQRSTVSSRVSTISNETGNFVITADSTYNMIFNAGGSECMRIGSDTNVMINGSTAYARLTVIQDPTTGPHISTSTAYSITNGSYITLVSVTGMILVSNEGNGDTGFYLVGGRAAVYLNSTKGTWVTSTTSPAAGKTSVAYDGGSDKYRIYNNYGSTQNFFITYISNRNVI